MDDNTPVYIVNEAPTIKEQLIGAAIGIGVTLVTYGAIVGAVTVYSKVSDWNAKKQEKKNAIFIEPQI